MRKPFFTEESCKMLTSIKGAHRGLTVMETVRNFSSRSQNKCYADFENFDRLVSEGIRQ